MRDLQAERARRAGVREERLRATAGLDEASLRLTSWRGLSGRRYVVGIHAVDEEILGLGEAVLLAVRRDGDGRAEVVDIAASAGLPWVASIRARGATELHVHRLADDAAGRQAVIEDLKDRPEPGPAPSAEG